MCPGYVCKECAQIYLYSLKSEVKNGCKNCGSKNLIEASNWWNDSIEISLKNKNNKEGKILEEIAYVENILNRQLTEHEKQIYYNRSTEAAQWTKNLMNEAKHQPKCPTCQSTNIRKIGTLERGASVGMFGLFSKKINKTFKCNNCDYTW